MKNFSGLVVFLAALASSRIGVAQNMPILRFKEISPGLYRGARPDAAGIAALAALGVHTDLDLEDDSKAVKAEKKVAENAGLRFISKPMSGFWAPKDRTVDEVLALLNDTSKYPLFVHCLHGEDRTGLTVGLHRVFSEEWTPKKAYSEMLDLGFHPILIFLNHYFEERSGFED